MFKRELNRIWVQLSEPFIFFPQQFKIFNWKMLFLLIISINILSEMTSIHAINLYIEK